MGMHGLLLAWCLQLLICCLTTPAPHIREVKIFPHKGPLEMDALGSERRGPCALGGQHCKNFNVNAADGQSEGHTNGTLALRPFCSFHRRSREAG